jgi:exosome complex component RRP46
MSKTTTREHPTIKEINVAKSLHVLSFSSKQELLLAASEGRFTIDEWEVIEEKARIICLGDADTMADDDDEVQKSVQDGLKSTIEEKVRRDERWKNR